MLIFTIQLEDIHKAKAAAIPGPQNHMGCGHLRREI